MVYDVDSDGNITIVQSQRGEQASIFWSQTQILQAFVFIVSAVNSHAFALKIPLSSNAFRIHLNFLCD